MRILLSLLLFLFTCSCSATTNKKPAILVLPPTIESHVHQAYTSGKSILLFGYNEENKETEAYADWAGYLNDFKLRVNDDFLFFRIDPKILVNIFPNLPKTQNFSLFIKLEQPSYYYEDFIVEPQVYTSIEHAFQNKLLTPVDKAFLPERVLFTKLQP